MTNLSDKYKDSLPFDSSNITTIVSNYTASNNETVFVNSASSALTVTLPSSPTQGSKIKVLDVATNSQNNNITVLGNGNNIGGASAYIINTPDSSVEVMYINEIKGWNILNEYISLTKPGSPTGVSAIDVGTERGYNNGAATVTFTPALDGDLATSFTVTSTPGSYTATGSSSPIVVPGLQSNTSYTFKVFATNAAGNSTESTASSSITATTVPQAPTITSISYGFEKLSVSYTTGANGGKAISTYTATRTGGVSQSGTSPIAFTSLTGTSYEVTMTATNENGTSAPSAAQSQTPFTASGGTTSISNGYRYHEFTTTSNFILSGNTTNIDIFLAGGGGGGGPGFYGSGGGGAGGNTTTASAISCSPGTYSASVGAGGAKAVSGSNSSITIVSTYTGNGGGGASGYSGASGGSGGGGGTAGSGAAGGGGTNGGNGGSGTYGAGTGQGTTTRLFGDGALTLYSGGGGGGGTDYDSTRQPGAGGAGGGGAGGAVGGGTGVAGTVNLGGGGGGGGGYRFNAGGSSGGAGGSGIVVVRYLI
jgi:hypothetical protein